MPSEEYWPFDCPPETKVLAMRSVLEGSDRFNYAKRDEAGRWYFCGFGMPEAHNFREVPLSEVLRADSTIAQLRGLKPGWNAFRHTEDEAWRMKPSPDSTEGKTEMTRQAARKKIPAGICGILLGAFGIHKFILGYTTPGVIMLLSTILTCGYGGIIVGVIGIIEGIIYLTQSDEQFCQNYITKKRHWF